MEVISEISGVSYEDIAMINLVYDIFANWKACTSIIVQNQEGKMLFGRNVDYFLQQYYSSIAVVINYIDSDGRPVYQLQTFAGHINAPTGIRFGKYAISGNQRTQDTNQKLNIYNLLFTKSLPAMYHIRKVVETVDSYDEALKQLQQTKIVSSIYYIVEGAHTGQGAVIERNRNSVH